MEYRLYIMDGMGKIGSVAHLARSSLQNWAERDAHNSIRGSGANVCFGSKAAISGHMGRRQPKVWGKTWG
jgi:hypothetical protein